MVITEKKQVLLEIIEEAHNRIRNKRNSKNE